MAVRKPVGQHLDLQQRVAELLQTEGPMTHDEIERKLAVGYERENIQAVFRGLADNGLLESQTDDTGQWKYSVPDDIDVDGMFDLE